MQKKIKNILPVILIIFLGLMLFLISFFKRIPLNEEQVTGNSAGNLNNKGLFCEFNDKVYFANAYDDNTLYCMNSDESNYKKIANISVCSLNIDSHRIYYVQTGISKGSGLGYLRNSVGLFSCNHKGDNILCYTKDRAAIAALSGNHLYFQHHHGSTTTDKIHIRKDEIKTVLDDMISPSSIITSEQGNTIFYNGMKNNHYLYSLDTKTDKVNLIWKHNVYNPIYQNGIIYFLDLETDYELHSYNLSTGEEKVLSTDRCDYFNVYDSIIYYQKNSPTDPALKRISIDGTKDEVVRNGIYENVNITSKYVYFQEFNRNTPVFHQSTFGEINPEIFQPEVFQTEF